MTTAYIDNLNWRYATKKFDPTKKLTQEQLDGLLEAMRLSASSFGLQPYKFFVITNPALREKIKEHAWGQPQIGDASHVIAFCAYRTIDEAFVDSYIQRIADVRGMTPENLKDFRAMMIGSVQGRSPAELAAWTKCQTYIALGFLLSAAAQHKIDACPMEGFDPVHVDTDLDLAGKNLTTVALCAVGFRATDDSTASYKKVRFPMEELIVLKN